MRRHIKAKAQEISIHVLRVEDDVSYLLGNGVTFDFNPRPPCGGRRASAVDILTTALFQSTSSVWRTTGETGVAAGDIAISIHVLRVEDDASHVSDVLLTAQFQSTSSVWRTTWLVWAQTTDGQFQSTSSVWRTTWFDSGGCTICLDFNPRPPCGGRPACGWTKPATRQFQSTSSVWRTTEPPAGLHNSPAISIHVLRVEDDPHLRVRHRAVHHFNPRPPCGGRHVARGLGFTQTQNNFNPRPPCGGRHVVPPCCYMV